MPIAASSRAVRASAIKARHSTAKLGPAGSEGPSEDPRGSCFHSATKFSTSVTTAAPWITCTSRVAEKSTSSDPIASAASIVPASSIT